MIIKAAENPVVKPTDVKPSREEYRVLGAFNPGAITYQDEILLFLRVAEGCVPKDGYARAPIFSIQDGVAKPDLVEFPLDDPDVVLKDTRGIVYKGKDYLTSCSHIRIARSKDGIHFTVDDTPFIAPHADYDQYGVEDVRAVQIEGKYYLNYTVVSQDSWCTELAVTEDFVTIERLGIIFHPENKDVTLFPEKINGKYHALHRPNNSGFGKASIWYAQSPDLVHWGKHQCLLRPRDLPWESMKIGGGAPPVRTSEGWLTIYHGKGDNGYTLFCLLLDLEDPAKIVRQAEMPLLAPDEKYEVEGFFGNVVFSNGMVEKDGNVFIYYGAADETSCVAITDMDYLLNSF